MAKAKPVSTIPKSSMFATIAAELETIQVEDYRAPSEPTPSGVEPIGIASDHVRRLMTMDANLREEQIATLREIKVFLERIKEIFSTPEPEETSVYVRAILESGISIADLDRHDALKKSHLVIHAKLQILRSLITAELVSEFRSKFKGIRMYDTLEVYSDWSVAPAKNGVEDFLDNLVEDAMNASRRGNGSGYPVPEFDGADDVSAMFDGLFGGSNSIGDFLRDASKRVGE